MPNYKSAADVRTAHPGVYDDLSDQQIEAGLAKQNGVPARPGVLDTDQSDPNGERLSFTGDPSRYLGHMAKGIARSPVDLVKGLLGIPGQVAKGLTQDLPTLVKDPSLLLEAPRAIGEAATYANTHPEDTGSLLGQMVLGEHAPAVARTAVTEGPGLLGRGLSATGRAVEKAGKSKAVVKASELAPLEALTGHLVPAAISAVAPSVLEGGGRLMQRGGASLEGLKLARKAAPAVDPFAEASAMTRKSKEVPGSSYPEVEPNAFTGNGPKAAPGSDAPFTHEGFVNDLERSAGVQTNGGLTQTPAYKGLQEAIRQSNLTPAQKFTESEPQIGVDGGGRTTGQASTSLADDMFGSGGGLDDVNNGRPVDQHVAPSTLDELSQLSGRALSPTDAQALLNKYRRFGAVS